ncbi:mucin-2 [Drosophila madeirensis]|uniref:Mucin-2 n=1 Tax=Drosophila madeirensis TaxID=30013 RepID=A0AAU9FKE9_DROMD
MLFFHRCDAEATGTRGTSSSTTINIIRPMETKMTLRLVSILSAAALLFLWPAQLDAFITPNTGCHHNGTWFADKSVVPSMEKCLSCQCNRKTLVCRLKVCPEMPMPPPRGCVVVQKKSSCCPYLSCARLDAFYKIPTKRRIIAYLDHYERESIDRVVNDNMLQRRSDDSDTDLFVCVKNGTVYKSGSAMSSSNLCSYCYCIGGTEKCVKPKCMLPVDGCKPIFVDSTCCPVRYDCSSKMSGKSSQEVRYRKTSNKHFQRMSQRLQRNRGCTVGSQFYAEGQKMRSDVDRPCDICFCIRGTRRCAPKKCSPALKNCIPVVPKGQCCPSSYDCGSQRDYRRSHNSRQFNLYNMLFGKEEQEVEAVANAAIIPQNSMAERYPHDRHPTRATVGDPLEASSEKSILDTLREGLEFIDGNNNQMLANNLDLVGMRTTAAPATTREESTEEISSSTTALSFLDLLLGPSTESGQAQPETTTTKNTLSWMDILLGPDEEELPPLTESYVESSTVSSQPEEHTSTLSSIKRIADDFDEQLDNSGIAVGELPAEAQHMGLTNAGIWPRPIQEIEPPPKEEPSLLNVFMDGLSGMLEETNNETSTTTTTTTTRKPTTTTTVRPAPMFRPLPSHKLTHNRINSKLANLTVTPPMLVVTSKYGHHVTHRLSTTTTRQPTSTTTTTTKRATTTTKRATTTAKPTPAPTTAKSKPKTTRRTVTTTKATTTTTTTERPTTTTTERPTTTTTIPTTTMRTNNKSKSKPKIKAPPTYTTSTSKPLEIKTNPTILEAEPMDSNGEPTLPPSLPNLKIIPFLPTDAVETVPQESGGYPSGGFYQNPLQSPSQIASDKMDVVSYETVDDSVALYAQPNPDQAAYKYKFNVEVPAVEPAPEPVVHVGGQYQGSAAYVKFDFDQQVVPPAHSGFSPPTETEGGFMPKEPLVIDGEVLQEHVTSSVLNALADSYHVTQHIIDITSGGGEQANDTSAIEITTPDPFKDVIHTETPPNLDALIEDKANKQPIEEHIETVTYSISNSTVSASTSSSGSSTTEKQLPLINKFEINKLDKLLDELLGMELPKAAAAAVVSSTVPPFKQMPDKSTQPTTTYPTSPTTTTISSTTTNPSTSTSTTARPTTTTRGTNKKGNSKTKTKQSTGNRRNPGPSRTKIQTAPRRTLVNKSSMPATVTRVTTRVPQTTTTTTTTTTTRAAEESTTITAAATSTMHPFLNSPFDKLPFMDTSYEVRPHRLQPQQQQVEPTEQQFHHYQHAPSTTPTPTTSTTEETPRSAEREREREKERERERDRGSSDESPIDPMGMLKLAGCNIYGRMYRVGRIIVELSSQCLECKCTEVGVKCGPLDC